jgi:hypothetical protein
MRVNPTASAFPFSKEGQMNIQNLNRGSVQDFGAGLRGRIGNAYERLAGSDDYQKNENNLKVIQFCVVTLSAGATGFVNSLSHVGRLGWPLAILLALLITGFVEKFFFTLRHGLTTVYKSGSQRLYAQFWYRVLMGTMVLNVALLGLWIVGISPPAWLLLYNHYSIGIHFAAALIGVTMVRDADAVIQNRILELRAETGRQDLVTARKSGAIGSPLALVAAKLRGVFDAVALSFRLLFSGGGFSKKYMAQLAEVEAEQFSHIDAIGPAQPTQAISGQRNRLGFGSENTRPKSPAPWI